MTTTVKFTRKFVSGNLKGLTHCDKLSFADYKSARGWIDSINANKSLNYVLEDYRIESPCYISGSWPELTRS